MKQGSTDDPFADDPDDEMEPDEKEETTVDTSADLPDERERSPQRRSLPYIHSRDGVKEGRTQRPIFLRDHVEDGIDELVDRMEEEFDQDVYKTDVTEAAMAVAQEHPNLVQEKLGEWGYGWD